jgi:hypothetical protein
VTVREPVEPAVAWVKWPMKWDVAVEVLSSTKRS